MFNPLKERLILKQIKIFEDSVNMTEDLTLKEFVADLERDIIKKVLLKFNGNQKDVAKFLGLKYTTLNEKIKKYNIHFQKRI